MKDGSTYWNINNGDCENFASCVIDYLSPEGETDNLYMVSNDNFKKNDKWDKKLLKKYWKDVKSISWKKLNNITFGNHTWITDGKYHYDAECHKGTKNFFELPLFKSYLK